MSIKDAQAVLNGCTMRGSRGHGVHAMGKSTCLVEQCTIDTAEMCGVHIDAGCRGVLVNSSMASCKLNGLFFGDEASGVVNGCDVSSNGYPGIGIKNADPVVMHNRVHHNSRSGIVVSGGMPTLEDNNVFANGVDGVVVAEQATCVMQGAMPPSWPVLPPPSPLSPSLLFRQLHLRQPRRRAAGHVGRCPAGGRRPDLQQPRWRRVRQQSEWSGKWRWGA